MFVKIHRVPGFSDTLQYVSRNDDRDEAPQIFSQHIQATEAKAIAEEMKQQASKSRAKTPCYHFSLSLPKPDIQAGKATTKLWAALAQDFLKGMKLGENQAVGYLHTDTTYTDNTTVRPHIHIIANRVKDDGKAVKSSFDVFRAQKVVRDLEAQYGLSPEPSSWEIPHYEKYKYKKLDYEKENAAKQTAPASTATEPTHKREQRQQQRQRQRPRQQLEL